MSLYGTRNAAINWQAEVAKEMVELGFKRGKYIQCLYWNPISKLMVATVHRDVCQSRVEAGGQQIQRTFGEPLRD